MNTKILAFALASAALVGTAFADVPSKISPAVPGQIDYQGTLSDPSSGMMYSDGVYEIDFRVWNAANGGTCLWGAKYSVMVRNGFFNVRLGDENATALTGANSPTYGLREFWKAMWPSESEDNTRYLGVTLYANADGKEIEEPTELMPRQQLLSSPFAFRAQTAKYAEGAEGDFAVSGKMTVEGTATFNGNVVFPSGLASTAPTQQVGPLKTWTSGSTSYFSTSGSYTAANDSNRDSLTSYADIVAKYVNLYSYYSINVKSTKGDVVLSAPTAGKAVKVSDASMFVSEAKENVIGGEGKTTIAGSTAEIAPVGAVTLKPKTGGVSSMADSIMSWSTNQTQVISPNVIGFGDVKWAMPVNNDSVKSAIVNGQNNAVGAILVQGAMLGAKKPFKVKTVTVTVPVNTLFVGKTDVGENDWYIWSISDWEVLTDNEVGLPTGVAANAYMDAYSEGDSYFLNVSLSGKVAKPVKFHVHLIGIHKSFCEDARCLK